MFAFTSDLSRVTEQRLLNGLNLESTSGVAIYLLRFLSNEARHILILIQIESLPTVLSASEPFKPQPPNPFVQRSYTRRPRMDRVVPLDKHILYHHHQFLFAHPGNITHPIRLRSVNHDIDSSLESSGENERAQAAPYLHY